MVGADQTLGGWEVGCAPEMRWGEGHRWSVRLELPEGFESEYKLVHCMPGKPPVWEHTPNRLLTVAAPPSQEDPSSSAVEVELQWCSPPHATSEPVEMVVAATLDANDLSATTPAFKVGPPLFESFSSGESGSISVTDVEEVGILADQEKEKERDVQVSETTTVLGAIDAAIMSAEEERIEETNSLEASQQESAFKSAAKTAGAVALGVAGAALLSALAIDVADTAIMGAVAVAAGSAALSGSTSSKKKSQKDGAVESLDDPAQRGDFQLEGENRTTTSTEPGVIIAAGIMSALDAGKAVVKSFDKDVERDEE